MAPVEFFLVERDDHLAGGTLYLPMLASTRTKPCRSNGKYGETLVAYQPM